VSRKYLSPYVNGNLGSESYCRRLLGSDNSFYVWRAVKGEWYHVSGTQWDPSVSCSSFEEASNALDKELIEQGYIFLTEDQWDKYQLLC
jgi:hypothetical protein